MSKTYEALMEAERLRATQEPAAVARQLARVTQERETLWAELRACQDQLAALVVRVDAARTVDPALIEDLGAKVARLSTQQEQLAAESKQRVEAAMQLFKEELDSHSGALQSHSKEVAAMAQQLHEIGVGIAPSLETLRRQIDELRGLSESQHLGEQTERETLADRAATLRADLETLGERLTAADEAQQRRLQVWEAQLAEQRQALPAEAKRIVQDSIDESQAAQQIVLARLAAVEKAQSKSELRLHSALEALQASQPKTPSADEIEALRTQVAFLVEAHGRQQEMAERVESAKAAADEAARRVSAIEDAGSRSTSALQQQMAALHEESARLHDAVGSVQASLAAPLRAIADIATLRTQVGALSEAQARYPQLAEGVQRAQAGTDEIVRRVAASDKQHADRWQRLQQQFEELQRDRGILHDAVVALQTARAPQAQSPETETLRTQIAALVEAQTQREQALLDKVESAQAAADEAIRRSAATSETQETSLSAVQQQVAALQADGESLHDALGTLRASFTRQVEAAGDIEALRTRVARLMQSQARQQDLMASVGRAQTTADEAVRRVAMIHKENAAELTTLQQHLSSLLADKAKQDQMLERRFELLCAILDETIERQKEEVDRVITARNRGTVQPAAEVPPKTAVVQTSADEQGASAPAEAPDPPRARRKTLTNRLIRRTSSRKFD